LYKVLREIPYLREIFAQFGCFVVWISFSAPEILLSHSALLSPADLPDLAMPSLRMLHKVLLDECFRRCSISRVCSVTRLNTLPTLGRTISTPWIHQAIISKGEPKGKAFDGAQSRSGNPERVLRQCDTCALRWDTR